MMTPQSNLEIDTSFVLEKSQLLSIIEKNLFEPKMTYDLILSYHQINLLKDYDQLLCLNEIKIEKYWHQIETVKRVLKYFRGRVLLCDEVGLGKTIEAGMLIKEYLLRGLAKKILILTPPSLISQWREEMLSKFREEFATNEQSRFKPEQLSKYPLLICSINFAKSKNNFERFVKQEYDLVVVDEAHHLKNPKTLNWELINSIKKKFIFLLTATPVQNNLIELFNLLTLLKPGVLNTEKKFKSEYVSREDPKKPENPEKLRELLREVMIRNTRSLVDIKLPKRFAQTFVLELFSAESELYQELNAILKNSQLDRLTLSQCLRCASSSLSALKSSLENMAEGGRIDQLKAGSIIKKLETIEDTQKENKLIELLLKSREKKVVFVHFMKTMDHLKVLFQKIGLNFVEFRGSMSIAEKDQAIDAFSNQSEILLSSESGGEGRNLQFCNTLINYDLPWNPMQIEQRIGRVHRIGQVRDVFIFNLCQKGSIEDHLLRILEHKINMFELVIGEIGSILGNLRSETEFSDIILNLWLQSSNQNELAENFEKFGEEMLSAKDAYLGTKALDQKLFEDDYET